MGRHAAAKDARRQQYIAAATAARAPWSWLPTKWHPSNLSADLLADLRGGILQAGHVGRLRRVLAKADEGEPIVMTALGNSVTADFGGTIGSMQDRFKLGYMGTPRRCRGECLEYGWLLPIFRGVTRSEHPNNNGTSASALVNCGQAARFVTSYLDCMGSALPEEADLIIIDGVNGMTPINGKQFRPTEKLLRRLLGLPHQPAVLILHWIDWCACLNCKPGPRIDRHRKGECYVEDGFQASWHVGVRREESGGWADLAQHYRLPVLSIRRALHPRAQKLRRGTRDLQYRNDSVRWQQQWRFTFDGLHPHPCQQAGKQPTMDSWENSCIYSLLVATMFNVFLADVRSGRLGASVDETTPLPVPCKSILTGALEPAWDVERCFGWGVERALPPPITASAGWRLTALDTASSFDPPRHCTEKPPRHRPAEAIPPPPPPLLPCPSHKPGFTAFEAGSVANFDLPLLASAYGQRTSLRRNATLMINYLSSYEGMGIADLSCTRGCECATTAIDGHRWSADPNQRFVSVWESQRIAVVVPVSSSSCALRLELRNHTNSGGRKFKLTTITLKWIEDKAMSGDTAGTPQVTATCRDSARVAGKAAGSGLANPLKLLQEQQDRQEQVVADEAARYFQSHEAT